MTCSSEAKECTKNTPRSTETARGGTGGENNNKITTRFGKKTAKLFNPGEHEGGWNVLEERSGERGGVLCDVFLPGRPVDVPHHTLHHPLDAFVHSIPRQRCARLH